MKDKPKIPNPHMKRAKREGIPYIVAKARNHAEQFKDTIPDNPDETLDAVLKCQKPPKLMNGHLSLGYTACGRIAITTLQVLSWFERGFDFENHDPTIPGRYCSIRDFAPGATIQFRYGKRLQKTFTHTLP